MSTGFCCKVKKSECKKPDVSKMSLREVMAYEMFRSDIRQGSKRAERVLEEIESQWRGYRSWYLRRVDVAMRILKDAISS